MHSTFLEQKHYSPPLDCLEIKRRKTVAFIPVEDSFELLPMVSEGSEEGSTKTTINIHQQFNQISLLLWSCHFYVAYNSLCYHMAFYKGNIICQHQLHRAFCYIAWCSSPKATPLLKAVKNRRHEAKAESLILADKVKSSSDIAPIAEQVKSIRQLWLKNLFRWIQRLSQQPSCQTTSSVFTD